MIRFCTYCYKEQETEIHQKMAVHKFRNDYFELLEKVAICKECGHEVPDEELDSEVLKCLGELYLERNALTKEDIKQIRIDYGFSQRQFAKILNWSKATVARYELGTSVPDPSHLGILKMLKKTPASIEPFFQETQGHFPEEEKRIIEEKIKSLSEQSLGQHLINVLQNQYQLHEMSFDNGFVPFSINKIFNMVIYFAQNGVLKTKLMKLLWYADFLMFKRHLLSISGVTYCRFQHGPVPKNHDLLLSCMERMGCVNIDEQEINDYTFINIVAKDDFDETHFSVEELEILKEVNKYFADYGSVKIRDFSHQELGWKETVDKQIISYKYADQLQLS